LQHFGGTLILAENEVEQLEVHYSGRVQGVGFRYTVRSIAVGFKVTGFVRNLHDGRVQMVVEGHGDVVAEFIRSIQAEMGRYIHDSQSLERPATGKFDGFDIRF
jgi:acylphosphatase